MTDRPRRARRVQLSTPGSSEKMMQKASESKADHVFLDLEDAVAPSQKREARKKIVEALKTLNWKGKTRCVRINDLTTEYAFEDIIEVVEGAGEHLDTIMMTKVLTPADVLFADKLLHQLEKKLKLKRRIGLEARFDLCDRILGRREVFLQPLRLSIVEHHLVSRLAPLQCKGFDHRQLVAQPSWTLAT